MSQACRRLRALRIRLGLSQTAAALQAGLHQSAWSNLENGLQQPSLEQAVRIEVITERWGERLELQAWLTRETRTWIGRMRPQAA